MAHLSTPLPQSTRQGSTNSLLRGVGLLAALAVLGGCGSSGPAREDIFYRLDPGATPQPVTRSWPATVLVSKFDGRGFAGDRAIVFRDASKVDQVQRYTYHLWAEAPPLSVQDLLASYLREANTAQFIVTPSQRVSADLVISGTLFRFEHRPFDSPPSAHVELELAVVRSDRRQPLFIKRYEADMALAGTEINLAVGGFNRALKQIFAQFLTDLEPALATLPAPSQQARQPRQPRPSRASRQRDATTP